MITLDKKDLLDNKIVSVSFLWTWLLFQFLRKKLSSEKDWTIICVSCRDVSKKSINTKPHRVRTFLRIPLFALRLFLFWVFLKRAVMDFLEFSLTNIRSKSFKLCQASELGFNSGFCSFLHWFCHFHLEIFSLISKFGNLGSGHYLGSVTELIVGVALQPQRSVGYWWL